MGLLTYLRGWVRLEFRGAFPESVLNACAARNLEFWGVEKRDAFTIRVKVRRRDAETLAAIVLRCQCEVTDTRPCGAPVTLRRLRPRYGLLAGGLACLAALMFSSCFVWNVRVVGNESVSSGTILRALNDCGAGIGSFWPAFTGDSLRNELLLRLPELKWAAVNYDSSTITVIVRERTEKPDMVCEDVPTHVTAAKSGLITEMQVYRGEAVAGKGITVLAGETLISGVVSDLSGDTRLVHAVGSVKARTWYELTASRSLTAAKKTGTGRERTRYALTFGTKRVNIYGNSSIYDGNCDKIIKEYPLALDGVFTLPVRLVQETCTEYTITPVQQSPDALAAELETQLTEYLTDLLGKNGEITRASVSFSQSGGVLTATLHAECLEEIGKEVPMTEEEIRQVRMNNTAGDESADD